MNKKAFITWTIAMCCYLSVSNVWSQTNNQPQPEKDRKFFISLGGAGIFLGNDAFGGGNFTFGFTPSPKNLLTFEIGGGIGQKQHLGNYSYTITTTNSNGTVISRETKNDGEISYEYSIYEVLLSWNRMFELSDKWQLRVGPSIGAVTVSGSDLYSPTSYEGTTITGIPDSKSESESAFMAAVNADITWNFAKRFFLDFGYSLSINSGVTFKERDWSVLGNSVTLAKKEYGIIGNRISVAIGWRF